MSMGVDVWAAEPFDLPAQLPASEKWNVYEVPIPKLGNITNYAYESDGWQVLVTLCELRKPTPPDSIRLLDGFDAHVAVVALEPIGADETGYAMLEQTVRALASATNGRWIDPANGTAYDANAGSFDIR